MLDTTINVRTENFDGPLALLLHLIQKEQMDIKKLDLTKITKQYLNYIGNMRELNFDVAGDYLFLAATLLLLKSKNVVTEEDAERLKNEMDSSGNLKITSEAELIRRLEELQHFQRMSEKLWSLPKKGHEIFVKPKVNRKEIVNSILTPIELNELTTAMMDLIQKEKRKYAVVRRDRLSIKEKLKFLKKYLSIGTQTDLETLLDAEGGKTIDNIVITFISLLELARLKKIKVFQNETMGNIYVDTVESLNNFDVEMADGFDDPDEEKSENNVSAEELEQLSAANINETQESAPSETIIQ